MLAGERRVRSACRGDGWAFVPEAGSKVALQDVTLPSESGYIRRQYIPGHAIPTGLYVVFLEAYTLILCQERKKWLDVLHET